MTQVWWGWGLKNEPHLEKHYAVPPIQSKFSPEELDNLEQRVPS